MNAVACKISTDSSGKIRPEFEKPYQVIGTFLDDDVQRCIDSCQFFLNKLIEPFVSGHELTGNAHSVKLLGSHVQITNNYDDSLPSVDLTSQEFIEILLFWENAIIAWNSSSDPSKFSAFKEFSIE